MVGVPEAVVPAWSETLHYLCALVVSASGASGNYRILGAATLGSIALLVIVHSTVGARLRQSGEGSKGDSGGNGSTRCLGLDVLGIIYIAFALGACMCA